MKLVGMMSVRNEAWVLGLSARVALMWCDELIVLNHASTDGTVDILRELSDEVGDLLQIIDNDDAHWNEMQHRQTMLEWARQDGATHLAIIDADEVLTGNLLPDRHGLRDNQSASWGWYPRVSPGHILQLPGYNLRNPYGARLGLNRSSLFNYHSNGIWSNRWFSTAFRDDPRLGWHGDQFHHREPWDANQPDAKLEPYTPIAQGQGGTMHLWGANERRLRAKHTWYKVTERLRWPEKDVEWINTTYSLAIKGLPTPAAILTADDLSRASVGNPDTWTYASVPASWWAPYQHLMRYLDVDAEPWQEVEVRRLVAEHGKEKFQGLDLFGVA